VTRERANVYEPEFHSDADREGFRSRRAQVGRHAGSERLGLSVYELDPGNATFPYHYHLGNEELLVVLRGRPHLRGPEGWRELEEGEVVALPVGERGAHQVFNRSDKPVRFLVASEMRTPEVVVYPDSDKVGAREYAPGSGQEGLRLNFRSADGVDYWEDERPPEVSS
jgi:uncharacterized cupin superfamily protein